MWLFHVFVVVTGLQSVAASQFELEQKTITQVVMSMKTASSQAGLEQPVNILGHFSRSNIQNEHWPAVSSLRAQLN